MEAIENIGVGILIIFFGIGVIFFVSRRPPSYPLVSVKYNGYIGGITIIILGIVYILNKLHLW